MIPILLDYETLRIIWWMLLGILLIGFAIMDGFDMGVAFLNWIIGRTDLERRIVLNSVGPVWDGNQVWLLLAGGAVFAAFPLIYATAFSGFYIAMLLVLLSLIVRPVSFEYRNKFSEHKRKYWDIALFASGVIPPLVFGVAFGNLFQGVPFYLDDFLKPHYVVPASGLTGWFGGLLGLLNPFALLCGIVSLAMLTSHGAVYLALKTQDLLQQRAKNVIYITFFIWLIGFIGGGFWVYQLTGYQITSEIQANGPSNPLTKEVALSAGVWLANYNHYPWLYLVPALSVVSAILTLFLTRIQYHATAFISSSFMIATTIITAGVALFPMLLPSSVNPKHSLTIWDASSSHLTLWLMTLAAVIFVPIVLFYTSWIYRVMRGPVTQEYIQRNSDTLY